MESNDNFRALAENANDGILIATGKGEHVYANKRAAEITGFSIQELLEIRMQDLAHPDELKKIKRRLKKRLEEKPVPVFYETAILRKDGKKAPVEISGAKTSWQGQPADIVIIRDISDRKHKQELLDALVQKRTAELRETTEQLSILMNATTDTVLLVDPKGHVVAANAITAKRFGTSLDQLLGKCAYDFMSPSLARSRKGLVNRVAETRKPHRSEEKLRGSIFYSTIYPVFDEREKVAQLAIYGRDITDQRQAEEAIREREKELEKRTQELEETNAALKVLLKRREEDRIELEEKVVANVNELVEPYVAKLKQSRLNGKETACLNIIESNLRDIVSPLARKLSSKFYSLTPKEIRVADLVKGEQTTKEIADLMDISIKTVEYHRNNIRKKLGINNEKVNLRSHLLSLL